MDGGLGLPCAAYYDRLRFSRKPSSQAGLVLGWGILLGGPAGGPAGGCHTVGHLAIGLLMGGGCVRNPRGDVSIG